jgi:hypothetical protein
VLILARRKHSTAADQPRLLRHTGRVWRRSQEVGDEASSQIVRSPDLNGLARPIPDRHAEEVQRIVVRIIPVIFMTGYSEYPVSTESGGNPIANHRAIMKPFRPRDLLSTVPEVPDNRVQAAA